MTSNGVTVENGSKPIDLCKTKHSITNGTYAENKDIANGESEAKVPVKKQIKPLSKSQADIVRLMGQHLREMGYNETLESLVAESGCPLEHPNAASFRAHVLNGDWEKASQSLDDLGTLLEDNTSIDRMRLLLLEEKYLEQLENGQEMEALHTLRHELAPLPLHHSDKHIQTLTSYMMFPNKDELREAASWPGVTAGSRQILVDKLQGFLPASVMLPPQRLQKLLRQAQELQVERCPFHYLDQEADNYSLLTDHVCSKSQFPCEMVATLTDHSDEVWFLKFSHDGSRLASGSKDGQIIIWNFEEPQPSQERVLKAQGDGIAYLDWSPNDKFLLSCGKEGTADVMIFIVETGEVKCHIQNAAEDSLVCGAWATNELFYVGGTKGQFYQCSLSGSVSGSWEGVRVRALATHPSTDLVYAADTHNRVRQYNFTDKTSSTLINESHPIMSFVLSSDGRQALVNVATQSVHMWDLRDRVLIRRYQGVTQGHYTIYSSYGGVSDTFLASGSEDNNVYIWHTRRETPVAVLKGHSRTVNCVSWNPVNFQTLVSGSDDGTVRIWGTEEQRKLLDYREKESRLTSSREQTSTHDSSGNRQSLYPESEGMDTHHSESTSELERTEESASSLSLSSEQLHDNLVSIAVDTITQSPRIEPIRFRSGSHPERRPPRTDSGQWSTASEPGDSAAALMTRLRSSSHGQDSSVDPDSSALSLDSSNGSQGDISQSEFDEGIRFSAQSGVIRTAPQQQRRSSRTRDTQQQEDEEGGGDMSTVV